MRNQTKSVALSLIVLITAITVVTPLLVEASTGTQTPQTLWRKMYTSNGAYDAIQTTDGGYAIISPGGDGCLLVKFDSYGNVEWSRSHGYSSYAAYPESVVQTSDGGYAITGLAQSEGGYAGHVWLFKTDSNGTMLWNKILGDDKGYQCARCLIQTSDGGFAITGDFGGYDGYEGPGGWNFLLMKTDSDGNLQWTKIIGKRDDDRATSIIQTSDGGFALTGCTSVPGNYPMFWLVKTNSAGNMQWNQSYPETNGGWAYDLTQTVDGGYALVGTAGGWSGSTGSIWLVKTDSTGNKQWLKSIGQTMSFATSVIQTSDGGYAVTGGDDFQLAKTDANGNLQWTYNDLYGPGISGTLASTVIQTTDGGYFLAGEDYAWIVKISDGSGPIELSPTPQPTVISNGVTINLDCQSSTAYTNFKVTIQGTLSVNNIAVPNEPIQLSYSVDGGASWEALTYLSTDDAGGFQAVWTPMVTGNYFIKASYPGNSEFAAATTTVHISVIPFEDTSIFSVASNSTVTAFAFNSTSQTLNFKVSGESGTRGYVNVYISKALMSDASKLKVYFDQELLQPTTQSVGDSWLVTFTYHHSMHSVALALNSDLSGNPVQPEPENLYYLVVGLGAAALVAVAIAVMAMRSRSKRSLTQ